jgi:hypothetical protein
MQDGTPTGGVQLSQGPLKGELAAVLVLTTQGVGVFGMITVSAPERIVACRQALFAPASVGCQQLALATVLCRRRRDDCAWSLLIPATKAAAPMMMRASRITHAQRRVCNALSNKTAPLVGKLVRAKLSCLGSIVRGSFLYSLFGCLSTETLVIIDGPAHPTTRRGGGPVGVWLRCGRIPTGEIVRPGPYPPSEPSFVGGARGGPEIV